jgi:hypothetical protein
MHASTADDAIKYSVDPEVTVSRLSLKTICMLVMINPVLDGAVVTICQMGNMAE